DRRGEVHLGHAVGVRSLVTDDHDIARRYSAFDQGVYGLWLVLEDSRRTDVHAHLLGYRKGLHHRAFRSAVGPQERDPTVSRERIGAGPDDRVPANLDVPEVAESFAHEELVTLDLREVLAQGLARDRDAVQVEQVAQLEHQGRHAAGVPEV